MVYMMHCFTQNYNKSPDYFFSSILRRLLIRYLGSFYKKLYTNLTLDPPCRNGLIYFIMIFNRVFYKMVFYRRFSLLAEVVDRATHFHHTFLH